jgi:dienelactone hydrolase
VLHLSGKNAGSNQVDAVAFAHPSLIEASDFEQLERPGLFLCCEHDTMFPKEKQEASKLVCEKRAKDVEVFSKFSYYPRAAHGWSIKGDETEPYSAKAMAHAATEVIGFFSQELN